MMSRGEEDIEQLLLRHAGDGVVPIRIRWIDGVKKKVSFKVSEGERTSGKVSIVHCPDRVARKEKAVERRKV